MTDAISCDVAILGAGIAGLNAAFVAAQHLGPKGRIVIVDRHERAGGMWNEAYPYVRLHQPHQLFTVGDIRWTLDREPAYLASRDEVAAHLRHCLEVVRGMADVVTMFGAEALGHEETDGGVRVEVKDRDGVAQVVEARHYIKTVGFGVEMNGPFGVTSGAVHDVSPNDITSGSELLRDDAPIWVVGSGKTAMDTIVHLASMFPVREINMIAGSGTYFVNRDKAFPTGSRRWFGGHRMNHVANELTRRFDGTNGADVRAWALDTIGISPLDNPQHNVLGMLSEWESDLVRDRTGTVLRDHLLDVVDGADGPELVLRSGARHPIATGSWIVNCTGLLGPQDTEYEPYASKSGNVVSINSTSVTFGFPSFSGYFLTHLLMRGTLREAPLVEVDWDDLQRHHRDTLTPVVFSALLHNLSVAFEHGGGAKLFRGLGLDFDRWYPAHRRLVGQLSFLRTHKRDRVLARQTLEAAVCAHVTRVARGS